MFITVTVKSLLKIDALKCSIPNSCSTESHGPTAAEKKPINMKTYGQDRVVAEISAWPQS